MSPQVTEPLSNLPPSAKLVYTVLDHESELTQSQLVEQTRLSARTVRYALNELEEVEAVNEEVYFADARKQLYSLDAKVRETGSDD